MSAPITGYTELDLIGFTDKGPFNPNATYFKNDLVSHSGIKWKVLTDNLTGVTPSEGANYTLYMKAVESFKGRGGSVLPMAGDYDADIVMLSSVMHIGGETQDNVEDALHAIVANPSGHNILNSSTMPMAGLPNLQFGGEYDRMKLEDNTTDPTKPRNIVHGQLWVCESESDWKTMSDAQFLAKYGANREEEGVYWYLPWATENVYSSDKTPVGTVITVATGKTADGITDVYTPTNNPPFPNKDYLVCNGNQVPISDYPQLANHFEEVYGDKFYFTNGVDPGNGRFQLPNWSADYPENGILCIKARITSDVITFAEVDETGLSSETDKVPSCARVAAIEAGSVVTIATQAANQTYGTQINALMVEFAKLPLAQKEKSFISSSAESVMWRCQSALYRIFAGTSMDKSSKQLLQTVIRVGAVGDETNEFRNYGITSSGTSNCSDNFWNTNNPNPLGLYLLK